MVWQEVKTCGNSSLHFLENKSHQVGFIVRILKVFFDMTLEIFGYQ